MTLTSPELMRRLRDGKDALRQARRNAPLGEKLRQLVYAQHLYVQVAGIRRRLNPLQRPWNILSDVSESVRISDNSVESFSPDTTGVAPSQWVRPKEPLAF